ncbi:MAG TPA: glycosyltransferase family 2 protein [Kiritimatiellia bacterium]|jgi:hypothetical protein
MDLSVIIVNWKSVRWLGPCLASIRRHAGGIAVEVVVVDNASGDGCAEFLKREHPEAVFLPSPENVGFARANNLGAKKARSDVLLFLNPDTEVREGSLTVLAGIARSRPRAGAIGCRILNGDGTLQTSCVQSFPTVLNQLLDAEALRRLAPRSRLWGMAPVFAEGSEPVPAEAISGACLAVRRDAFDAVGGFSEDYFMYTEDIDLCYKLARAGRENLYAGSAQIVHHGGGSSKQRSDSGFADVQMRESVRRFMRKHRGAVSAACYRAAMACSALVRLVVLAFGGSRQARAKWSAIFAWAVGTRKAAGA